MEKEFMEKVLAKLDKQEEFSQKMLHKLEKHDKKFDKVFAKLEEHDKKFEEHSKEIRSINNFLIVKEDELFNKIRALFDGYTAKN